MVVIADSTSQRVRLSGPKRQSFGQLATKAGYGEDKSAHECASSRGELVGYGASGRPRERRRFSSNLQIARGLFTQLLFVYCIYDHCSAWL